MMIDGILFDFDGTLADTAPDLAGAANDMRIARSLQPLPYHVLRPMASHGARGLVGTAFGLKPGDEGYEALRLEFLERYEQRLTRLSVLFDGVTEMLAHVERSGLRWGIVTNKATRYAQPLVNTLGLRPAALVCGDTTAHTKPHPLPLLHAAQMLGTPADRCVYVGDDLRDVQASIAAQMQPWVALWGYLGNQIPPEQWGASKLLQSPAHLSQSIVVTAPNA
ncbi:MAG: HAD family hydrolase [Burkholderiaceae bacterium]